MAIIPRLDQRSFDAVHAAMGDLMSAQSWGDATFISMPLYYPNGTPITVKVEPSQTGFRVSDGGLTYRELEQIGAERFFARNGATIAKEIDGFIHNRALCIDVTSDELSAAIADIADTTARVAHKIYAKVSHHDEAEIADHLYERLKVVFGVPSVERAQMIEGPSTKEWEVDAIVTTESTTAIFQAVSSHHSSVYSTSAMFHDLALLDRPPVTTAVVKSKALLGPWFNILAQAGNVIEEDQADAVYRSAVSWGI